MNIITYHDVLVDAKHVPRDPGIEVLDEEVGLLVRLPVTCPTV
jgi:hypothetical protein